MPNSKRKYQGDEEVVVYRIIEEDGRIGTYAVGRAKNPGSIQIS